ncbi:MAG: hypothetical protein GKR99_09120 [Rhodobacteraceae bacterium]|nr:hypothetical protein [Paracoccaceae bacterium]
MMDQPAVMTKASARIVGLYSYPKSGNTWVRSIIVAACGMPDNPGTLQRYVTDTHKGRVMTDPWAFQGRHWYFYKSHHQQVLTRHQGDHFATDRIVSIHRHPLDVFVSYLNFVSGNVAPQAGAALPFRFASVDALTEAQMETLFAIFLEHGTLVPQNRLFGSVFGHWIAFSALAASGGDVLLMRYEDLEADFAHQVARLCGFVGLHDVDLEATFRGADRRTAANGKFFWKRSSGGHKAHLSEAQIARFHERHGAAMQAMGYAL